MTLSQIMRMVADSNKLTINNHEALYFFYDEPKEDSYMVITDMSNNQEYKVTETDLKTCLMGNTIIIQNIAEVDSNVLETIELGFYQVKEHILNPQDYMQAYSKMLDNKRKARG